ncbi:hypothetical protein [Streptomyces sp. NL15-2K]|uniref:hypothetical protein n=1 Tax=Streptomyces sp. NL15-2K TaxID=376149 RepID=UPI000F575AAD|nr:MULTISPECIES: hypothetical protein [Actinomycetes]WKX09374.1 hypothetical protein Q4V64_18520 [Kutzneria buriramensis]GCB49124.1 hypothetical protein SNL152K_6457 [Streptomyces sp. NL15-2K]
MRSRRIPRWRLLTWMILAFNLAMLLWLVIALDEAGEGGGRCAGELCRDANDLGSTVGAWLVIFFWLAGVVLLGVAWLVTHRTEQPGPRQRRGWHRH